MPNEYPLTSFVKAFGKAYQTIDPRAALIRDAEEWRIVSIIMSIKIASAADVQQAYQQKTKGRKIVKKRGVEVSLIQEASGLSIKGTNRVAS